MSCRIGEGDFHLRDNQMKKIVIGGAGAYYFAPSILEDILIRYQISCELWLVDTDLNMAELTARAAKSISTSFSGEIQFFYTANIKRAVIGADAVIICADFLDEEAWRMDCEALREVGLEKQCRLLGGLGGVMQTLRACGFISELSEQMKEECPANAVLLLCDSGFGGLQLSRACHTASYYLNRTPLGLSGVREQTRRRLSLYLNVEETDLGITCAGINGFSWIVDLQNKKTGENLANRCMEEMMQDPREPLSSKYIELYGSIPAGYRVMQYEMLPDSEVSPKRTVIYSGVGAGDYEIRKTDLANIAVYGLKTKKGSESWQHMLRTGLSEARPITMLQSLTSKHTCSMPALTLPNTSMHHVPKGRFVELPATVADGQADCDNCSFDIVLSDTIERLTLCNLLYSEAAAKGNREALREGLQIDPALFGVDLLYAEDVLNKMMYRQKERLPRFDLEG